MAATAAGRPGACSAHEAGTEEKRTSPNGISAMNTQLTASIIVNNYNYGRFLAEAIDSALAQTYPNVEVIVVDDGSTDNSREIIAGYGNRIIPVLKENGGQGSALNAGFAASTGDLILFLDADDVLYPNAIEVLAREWRDDLSRIYFLLQLVDEEGQPCGGLTGGTTMPSPMLGPFTSGSSTTGNVLSRAALERVMPIPEEEWRIAPDFYVSATTSLFGEAKRLARPLGDYRVHGKNNGVCVELPYQAKKHIHYHLRLYDAMFRLTDGKVGSLENWLGRCPQHWICRIRLLRERPHEYSWPDTLPGLTVRAVKAAWRQPERRFHQRLAYSIYALAYGLFPRKLTRLLGKLVPMARIVAPREQQEESDNLARAAEQSRATVRA